MNPEWSHFVKRITVNAPVEKVYESWATRTGLEFWFLRQAKFVSKAGVARNPDERIQAGDRYHWLWHGYTDQIGEQREILQANGKDLIQFEFSGGCKVSVTVKREFDTTICELLQESIPLDDDPKINLYVGCGEGWTFYLANLKSMLEGGVDLRNKNVKIQRLINS